VLDIHRIREEPDHIEEGLARRGVEIRSWPIDPETGHLSESDLVPLLDERVRIPMQGGVESLNAAVAASLLCFRVAPGAE